MSGIYKLGPRFLAWVTLIVGVLWAYQSYATPAKATSPLQSILLLSWLIPLPMALAAVVGIFQFRRLRPINRLSAPLIFRVVTRGDNREAVRLTVANINQVMADVEQPPPWRVEVITDKSVGLPEEIVVPDDYKTSNGARWKARALQYAVDRSKPSANGWILHLDEESHIDAETVAGIAFFQAAHPNRIGQGAILYNRELRSNPFLTLADMLRTGDDIGRFYLQYNRGQCLFGMHGSFILVRDTVERAIGFNYPPRLCVTEDAYFGLLAMEAGHKFGWVPGFVYEQSPRSLPDFFKQRRRWFVGCRHVFNSPLPRQLRITLLMSWAAWTGSVLVLVATLANLLHPVHVPTLLRLGADFGLAIYVALYFVGLHFNVAGLRFLRRVMYSGLLLILIPVYALLEASAVIFGIMRPNSNFEVINK